MKYFAWAVISLGLLTAAAPDAVKAQQMGDESPFRLERNYPNPFNPETTIPFVLSRKLFDEGHRPVVSLRIYNVLAQLVAIPVLQGSGAQLNNVPLDWNGTGEYAGFWDGKILNTDREAASGVYVYQLVVDGRSETKKMTVIK